MDLLFSSTLPSVLVPALPFAFLTASLHYVSSVSLRGNQPPVGMVLTKHFLRSQVEELKSRFEEVKALGPAAAEEWMKGLDGNGKDKIADAARWEQWELAGGLRSLKSPHQAQSNGAKAHSTKPEAVDTGSARLAIGNHRPSNSLGGSAPATNLGKLYPLYVVSLRAFLISSSGLFTDYLILPIYSLYICPSTSGMF